MRAIVTALALVSVPASANAFTWKVRTVIHGKDAKDRTEEEKTVQGFAHVETLPGLESWKCTVAISEIQQLSPKVFTQNADVTCWMGKYKVSSLTLAFSDMYMATGNLFISDNVGRQVVYTVTLVVDPA